MKTLTTVLLLFAVLLTPIVAVEGLVPSGAAPIAASDEFGAVATEDTYSYFVSWNFEELSEKGLGEIAAPGAISGGGGEAAANGIFTKKFGFPFTMSKKNAAYVTCDTYITFYSIANEDVTITSANDLRGKGQVKIKGNVNIAYTCVRVHAIDNTTWEISERFYNYLAARKQADDYVVSIAIYTSSVDMQYPITFDNAEKTLSTGKTGTVLNFTLSRTAADGSFVPGDNIGDFTDTTDKSGEGIKDGSGELGGDANTTAPVAETVTLLSKLKSLLAELLNKSEEQITNAVAIATIVFLSLVGLVLLVCFIRLFKLLIPRR